MVVAAVVVVAVVAVIAVAVAVCAMLRRTLVNQLVQVVTARSKLATHVSSGPQWPSKTRT